MILLATHGQRRDVLAVAAVIGSVILWGLTAVSSFAQEAQANVVPEATPWVEGAKQGGFALAFLTIGYFYRKDFLNERSESTERDKQLLSTLTTTAGAMATMAGNMAALTRSIERVMDDHARTQGP